MRIVDPVRMGRPAVYCGLVAILLVSGAAHALTLRSSDGVDVEVDSSAAVAHSGLLRKHLVGPDTQDGIAVPTALNVASPELQHLVRFMHDTAPTDIGHAGEWVTSQMSWMDADTVGRVLAASLYLEMRAFLVAVASLDVDWYRVAAYRPDVNSALVLVTNAARLCRFARTAGQKAIVDQIRDALAVDATRASFVVNNAMWADGLRLLHWVVCHGDRNLMAFLLRLPGVDVNVRDIHQQTPLHWGVRADRQDMVALLLSTPNIDVNAESGRATALHVALSSMRYCTARPSTVIPELALIMVSHDIVDLLLHAPGVNVTMPSANGETPLHLAAIEALRGMINDLTVERLLSMPGINVNAVDDYQRTPLHTFLDISSHTLVDRSAPFPLWFLEALLNAPGVDVNARDFLLRAPLHLAAEHNNLEAIESLLQAPGINSALTDAHQRTAANLAWTYDAGTREDRRRRSKIMSILARHGPAAVS